MRPGALLPPAFVKYFDVALKTHRVQEGSVEIGVATHELEQGPCAITLSASTDHCGSPFSKHWAPQPKKTKTKQQRFGRFLLAFTTPKFEHLDRGFYDVN